MAEKCEKKIFKIKNRRIIKRSNLSKLSLRSLKVIQKKKIFYIKLFFFFFIVEINKIKINPKQEISL